jgi:predicted dehydrogenase
MRNDNFEEKIGGETMADLKFAVLGTGWWSTFQIAAWFEVGGVELVAAYNRTISKAEKVAKKFDIPRIYSNPEKLFQKEKLDFVDIITDVAVHEQLVNLAVKHKMPVICQKPMAPDYKACLRMVESCNNAGVPFMVHENYRWQEPVRALKRALDNRLIGEPFRARLEGVGYSPTEFIDQPFLKNLEQFIIADMGSHVLDVARFLFGEPSSLYCISFVIVS